MSANLCADGNELKKERVQNSFCFAPFVLFGNDNFDLFTDVFSGDGELSFVVF